MLRHHVFSTCVIGEVGLAGREGGNEARHGISAIGDDGLVASWVGVVVQVLRMAPVTAGQHFIPRLC